MSKKTEPNAYRFTIAFSFPGEHRAYVEKVDKELQKWIPAEKIFYDNRFLHEIVGLDSDTLLQEFYREQSELIVVFLCEEYKRKDWTGKVEWRSIRDLIKTQKDHQNIMLFKFGAVEMPGIYTTDIIPDISEKSPEWTAELIYKRLKILRSENSSGESLEKRKAKDQSSELLQQHSPMPLFEGPSYSLIVDELWRGIGTSGVFSIWEPPEDINQPGDNVSDTYLFRIFLQTLLVAATKMNSYAAGSANAWVCNQIDSKTGRPCDLRSEGREGYFRIDQLVVAVKSGVQYRANKITFGNAKAMAQMSFAAQAVVKGTVCFGSCKSSLYDSTKEFDLGISHIAGFPLYKCEKLTSEDMEGAPLAITTDFKFSSDPSQSDIDEIEYRCSELMELFQAFSQVWKGEKRLG